MTMGGMGYAKEYHVERYLRESLIARIAPVSRELILCYHRREGARPAEVLLIGTIALNFCTELERRAPILEGGLAALPRSRR